MRGFFLLSISVVLASWCGLASASYTSVLSTPQRIMVIVVACAEGDVSCANVKYTEVNKKTGLAITLDGSDWVRMCADGVTPCQHLGFKFTDGDTTYRVSDGGALSVTTADGKPIASEVGKWLER